MIEDLKGHELVQWLKAERRRGSGLAHMILDYFRASGVHIGKKIFDPNYEPHCVVHKKNLSENDLKKMRANIESACRWFFYSEEEKKKKLLDRDIEGEKKGIKSAKPDNEVVNEKHLKFRPPHAHVSLKDFRTEKEKPP